MSARVSSERGSAMVLAIMITLMMLALGLATFQLVEGQQRASAEERIRDSGYNLSDSALDATVTFMTIAEEFPDATHKFGDPTTGTCGPNSPPGHNCPDPDMITAAFASASGNRDLGAVPNWTVSVRDNDKPSARYYSETDPVPANRTGIDGSGNAINWDANADGRVWLRAEGIAQGRRRVLVALAERRSASTPAPYPSTGIFAYDLQTPPGAGFFIDMQGSQSIPGRLDLSCINPLIPSQGGNICPLSNAANGSIVPWTVTTSQNSNVCTWEDGTPAGNTIAGPFCWQQNSGGKIAELRARAQAAGTYYNGTCPASLTGDIVFIDFDDEWGTCSYASGSATWNTPENPGMLVLGKYPVQPCSTAPGMVCLNIAGNNTYYGLIYFGSTQGTQPGAWGVGVSGGAKVQGGIVVENGPGVAIGSSVRPTYVYDPKAFEDFGTPTGGSTTSEVKITPGTFHEIPSS